MRRNRLCDQPFSSLRGHRQETIGQDGVVGPSGHLGRVQQVQARAGGPKDD
eukprot:CAMPEP_0175970924 /NCGR_PEP_ID=MMETSP0108-20121206/41350_1 /TAXON_ID=195067 ORGANISM="Goniomonas pacifica, Strain CCMP1869" /NCGR_SAMPLE_ID=MMETSP0108 /ASSEMBLY_ACC=CAM_ASM_000204 /LENGTH=50 /DNA_ID=CAMNT_0017299997 /DNA_START=59 /DNA_END=208 /DNA_ORIENTATION=-